MDSSLMEFDFEDSVVEGLILDSVDWTDSRWEDLSIDTAAIHSLDGNIEVQGELSITNSSLVDVKALNVHRTDSSIVLTDSRIDRTELSAAINLNSAISGQLSDLEIHSLTLMGSVSDLQAEKLQLTYRKPAEVENSVECDDFESACRLRALLFPQLLQNVC